MSDKEEDIVIHIHPEALPDDMTQEELDEILKVMKEKIEEGTLLDDSVELDLDELAEEDPELYASIMAMEEEEEKLH